MNLSAFKNLERTYAVVAFIMESEIERLRSDLESLGNQRNVHLVVQPCEFEGIEFLSRCVGASDDFTLSEDEDVFWYAASLKASTSSKDLERISSALHAYLVSILEGDADVVSSRKNELSHLCTPHLES